MCLIPRTARSGVGSSFEVYVTVWCGMVSCNAVLPHCRLSWSCGSALCGCVLQVGASRALWTRVAPPLQQMPEQAQWHPIRSALQDDSVLPTSVGISHMSCTLDCHACATCRTRWHARIWSYAVPCHGCLPCGSNQCRVADWDAALCLKATALPCVTHGPPARWSRTRGTPQDRSPVPCDPSATSRADHRIQLPCH